MRLTLVYSGCHPRGGVERVIWEAALYLHGHHEVTVVAADVDPLPAEVSVRHVVSPSDGPWKPVRFRAGATKLLAEERSDLVVSFGGDCPAGDVLVVGSVHKAWVRRGGPVRVGSLIVPGEVRRMLPRHRVLLALEKKWIRDGSEAVILAVSPSVEDDLVDLYGVDRSRISVIPNGFSPDQCSPERRGKLRSARRQQLALADDDIAMLMIANEWHRKGLATTLEAMKLHGDPRLRLILVGRQDPRSYEAQIDRLGLRGRVKWYGPTDDVAVYHAAADLFVMPTTYEAFGTVIVEALASGVPVITSRLAGASSAIVPGKNGLLLDRPKDPAELAALLTQATRPGTLAAWSQTAAASVADFAWPAVMARFERILVDTAERARGTRTGRVDRD